MQKYLHWQREKGKTKNRYLELLTFALVSFITVRKRSLRRLYFYTCLSFCPRGGRYPSMHCRWFPSMPCSRSRGGELVYHYALQVSRPTPKGKLRGLARGVSRPTWEGGCTRFTPRGCVSQHGLRQTPQQLLLQVVCILLECILVLRLYLSRKCRMKDTWKSRDGHVGEICTEKMQNMNYHWPFCHRVFTCFPGKFLHPEIITQNQLHFKSLLPILHISSFHFNNHSVKTNKCIIKLHCTDTVKIKLHIRVLPHLDLSVNSLNSTERETYYGFHTSRILLNNIFPCTDIMWVIFIRKVNSSLAIVSS